MELPEQDYTVSAYGYIPVWRHGDSTPRPYGLQYWARHKRFQIETTSRYF